MNICVPSDCEFQILKPFYLFKQTNKKDRQSLQGFPGPEITWNQWTVGSELERTS